LAIHRISESKKGVSANQLRRELCISYKTAWYLCHRIREALKQPKGPGLRGIVEIDETYVKGKGVSSGEPLKRGHGSQRHTPVIGMKERDGEVRAKAIKRVVRQKTWPWIMKQLDKTGISAVYTDKHPVYKGLEVLLPHESIDHAVTYVLGEIHTNGIESFWSLLKRGIIGSYHRVSAKPLQRYVDEYCWRANHDKGDKFDSILLATIESNPMTHSRFVKQ
jgi:hypothetical protein